MKEIRYLYRITKVITISSHIVAVEISNIEGDKLKFIYNGKWWRWYTSEHMVDPELNKQLTRQYIKWLKRNGDREDV